MTQYEAGPFSSFNQFFIRKFRDGARPFIDDKRHLPAPAEARYFGWKKVKEGQTFPVKSQFLTADALLGRKEASKPFLGGPMLIARLCPVDYHRFHFPDSGEVDDHWRVGGALHSVSPIALDRRPEIFIQNERHVTVLRTKNFGRIAFIEVGALCVGKIVQTHDLKRPFGRGEEKGYFLFGGSTVIVLGEPGTWRPSDDILDNTEAKRETWIPLGDEVGVWE
jgi:phosphatidylserine decarboxylase